MKKAKQRKYFYRYRRADNGNFCSKLYAETNPATTMREKVKR